MAREIVEKAYAYVVRSIAESPELLVFRERGADVGLQVPKGTIEPEEDPREAVVRELREESGLTDVEYLDHLETDHWEHEVKPKTYRRHFYRLSVADAPEEWDHTVTGGGEDDGLVFEYFWIDLDAADLARDMDDYLYLL